MSKVLQKSADNDGPHGRLDPERFGRDITFMTYAPPGDIAHLIEHFWVIRKNVEDGGSVESLQIMHRPYVDIYFSLSESGVQGTFRTIRQYTLAANDRIIGVRFRPGAFHTYWAGAMTSLADNTLAIHDVFPAVDTVFIDTLISLDEDIAVAEMIELVRSRHILLDKNIDLISKVLTYCEASEDIPTIVDVATQVGVSDRTLQQIFRTYVGIPVQWILKRRKLLQAAQSTRDTLDPDWAAIAYDSGYSSQQHFITDFKLVIGMTPTQYKRSIQIMYSE